MSLQEKQKARRNYITECFGTESALKSCSAPKWSPWLTLRASSQLPPCPFHPFTTSQGPSHPAQVPQLPWSCPHIIQSLGGPWVPWDGQEPLANRNIQDREAQEEKCFQGAFRGLKIRCGLWEIMTIPSPTACRTNCKAHLPDPGLPL